MEGGLRLMGSLLGMRGSAMIDGWINGSIGNEEWGGVGIGMGSERTRPLWQTAAPTRGNQQHQQGAPGFGALGKRRRCA